MVLRQLRAGEAKVENQYSAASCRGKAIWRRCERWPKCSRCGRISSGAAWASSRNRPCEFARASPLGTPSRRCPSAACSVADPKAAQCGEVLKGVLKPHQCKLFGKECTPEHPIGALMVSSEGACAAHFKYEHVRARWRVDILITKGTKDTDL